MRADHPRKRRQAHVQSIQSVRHLGIRNVHGGLGIAIQRSVTNVASDANAYAVDTSTHLAVWSTTPGGWLSIAIGRLYVAQPDGTLAAYALTR